MIRSINNILTTIKEGILWTVSDGSFKDKFGTVCWILENLKGTDMIVDSIYVPSYSDEHNTYKGKLVVLYRIVITIVNLKEK